MKGLIPTFFQDGPQSKAPRHVKPFVLVLFGLAGSGKSTVREIIEEKFNFPGLEGDSLLDQSDYGRKLKHQDGQAENKITWDDVLDFGLVVISAVKQLLKEYSIVVLSQACYSQSTREQITKAFDGTATVVFWEISIHNQEVLTERIVSRYERDKVAVDPKIAEDQAQWFEHMPSAYQIDNTLNDKTNLFEQIHTGINVCFPAESYNILLPVAN